MKVTSRQLRHSLWLILLVMFLTSSVKAEPYIAQKFGLKCSSCHTNVTGGGKRNEIGLAYALSLTEKKVETLFSPELNDTISIGGNFRADWTYTTFDDPQPVSGSPAPAPNEDTSVFDTSNGAVYLQFDLTNDLLFYTDQQLAPQGGQTREVFGLFKNLLGEHSYIKAGKFFLPYGLRLQDDGAFIREKTGFNFTNSDTGIELGYEPGLWSISMAATNGTQGGSENNNDKQISAVISYVTTKYRIGFSATKNNNTGGSANHGYNIFAGWTHDNLVLLGEIDNWKVTEANVRSDQIILFLSANYLIDYGLNLKFSYDYYDPETDLDENELTRWGLIAEKFVNQFVQMRLGLRSYDSIPQAADQSENRDLIFTEIHLFF